MSEIGEKNLPTSEYAWTAYLAGALHLVLKAESLEDAHAIARWHLSNLIDPEQGAEHIPYTLRLRWYAATRERGE